MFKRFFIAFGVVLLVLNGCAGGPRVSKDMSYPVFTIGHVSYFSLPAICQKEHMDWDYDALSKVIVLKKDKKVFRLLIDSDRMLADQSVFGLCAPVKLEQGVVYVPTDFCRLITSPLNEPVQNKFLGAPFLRRIDSVVIDAGHGGKDPGAIGKGGLQEKNVVLDLAQRLRDILVSKGLKVYMSRSTDAFLPLPERSALANEQKADLFVSIHANANKSRWIEGFEVYYLTEAVDDDARALAASENMPLDLKNEDIDSDISYLKAIVWDMVYTENRKESIELAQYICQAVSDDMSLRMMGVKGAPFAVLKGAQMPAVLVEVGYISNREGEKKLAGSVYRQKMAESLARGILAFRDYAQGETDKATGKKR